MNLSRNFNFYFVLDQFKLNTCSKNLKRFCSNSTEQDRYSRKHQEQNRKAYESRRQIYEELSSENETFYSRLGVERDASQSDIKSSYYNLSKIHHPDVAGAAGDKAAEKFRLLTEAYNTLSDPDSRRDYDHSLNPVRDSSSYDISSWSGKTKRDFSNGVPTAPPEEMIARLRRDTAFERDKAANPRKYTAGSFRASDTRSIDSSVDYAKLYYRITKYASNKRIDRKDPSEFYSQHFWDSQARRLSDHFSYNLHRQKVNYGRNVQRDADSIYTIIVIVTSVLIVSVVSLKINRGRKKIKTSEDD